jgi:hypothetical protein
MITTERIGFAHYVTKLETGDAAQTEFRFSLTRWGASRSEKKLAEVEKAYSNFARRARITLNNQKENA